jgi:protein TIF31
MFDKFMQEAPQFSYNTNVFKNVKFAMNEEEIKEDEDLVLDLAKFLKEDAIAKLIKDLQNVENMPADSKNLEASFHSHGVNMRYLGHLSNQLKESDSNHLKFMLEREVVFRCCKHIFNEYIRSTCDPYISSVIAHLLNILLAPFPFLDYLNQEKIEYID